MNVDCGRIFLLIRHDGILEQNKKTLFLVLVDIKVACGLFSTFNKNSFLFIYLSPSRLFITYTYFPIHRPTLFYLFSSISSLALICSLFSIYKFHHLNISHSFRTAYLPFHLSIFFSNISVFLFLLLSLSL